MPDDPNDPLRALERELPPPPHLKRRVTATLTSRGLLRRAAVSPLRAAGALAAAVLLFAAGLVVGRRDGSPPADGRTSYALLLYEGREFDRQIPEQTYIAEYTAWAAELRRRGAFVEGHPLDAGSRVLSASGDSVVAESRDVASDAGTMAGFFIIRAADDAEALAIARTCPHLKHGGRIALRTVIPT